MMWIPFQSVAQISVERILNALPEGCLIALFAWVLLRVLRRQNSGTRFAVWFFALLTVAALPMLGGLSWTGLSVKTTSLGTSSLGSAAPAITIPGRWALFVFLAWALGSGIALLRLAGGLFRLRRLRRSCTPVVVTDIDPCVRKTVEAIRESNGVTIATSEDMRVPAAIGFWKRTIVLPAWALRELPANDLNVVLLHELAHLRRWDAWTNLIQKIVRSIFFFHPAVWWIENRLSVEREMACDDAVLEQTANPHGYATCLVSLLEKSLAHRAERSGPGPWSMAQAAVHRAREAALRLAQILDKNRPAATRVWRPALAIVASFSMLCLAEMPHAPQLIAFDRAAPENNSVREYSANAASVQPAMQMARVVPAALRIDGPSSGEKISVGNTAKAVHPRVRTQNADDRQSNRTKLVAARSNEATPEASDRLVETSASADQENAPALRTLVFMEATQYENETSGALVWNVQIWRVTLVSQVSERLARVPVARKT